MTRAWLAVGGLIAALTASSGSHAQVTLDVTKITCRQFAAYKITNPQLIAAWISGYYHGTRGEMVVDTQQLVTNADKLETYCLKNPDVTLMQAVETLGKSN